MGSSTPGMVGRQRKSGGKCNGGRNHSRPLLSGAGGLSGGLAAAVVLYLFFPPEKFTVPIRDFAMQLAVTWLPMDTSTHADGKLGFDECWELLAAGTLGRLALIVDGQPHIFPVNYVLVERRSIAFRSAGGTKLWGAMTSKPAALEIDGYDPQTEEAWSVVARGDTEVIQSDEEKAAVDALQLEPWQPGAKDHYVRLKPLVLTGRRFKVNKPDLWNTRLNDARRSSFE